MNLEDKFDKSWVDTISEKGLLHTLFRVNGPLQYERAKFNILPEAGSDLTFKAFRITPYDKVKVVIIGQDIYHKGAFNGVAFGNGFPDEPAEKIQPSLRNILKEVERCYRTKADPSLYHWAEQGVLLINTAHTVRWGEPGSHIALWKEFTLKIMTVLNLKKDLVWMLWGGYAHDYEVYANNNHTVIKTGHPSPLNRTNPFVGSGCFLECDKILGDNKIIW